MMLSSNVPPSKRGGGGGGWWCQGPLSLPSTARHKTYSCVLKYDTDYNNERVTAATVWINNTGERVGGGEGSEASASRYVKIKGTSYRPNTRGKMNDLTAKNAFRR